MSCRNEKKKLTHEDRFGRKFYCQKARLRGIRSDKYFAKKKMRRIDKALCQANDNDFLVRTEADCLDLYLNDIEGVTLNGQPLSAYSFDNLIESLPF